MTASLTSEPDALMALLRRQRALYEELKDLSDQQTRLIEAGQTQELLGVLAQRQQLVEQLASAHAELAPKRQRLTELADELPPPQREQLRSLVDEVQGLLQSIIEQDDRDRQQLQSAKRGVGGKLQQTVRSGSALNAYKAGPGRAGARFTDHRG